MNNKTWTTHLKESPELGDYLEIPPDLLEALGWDENTLVKISKTTVFRDDGDRTGFVIEKAQEE